METRLHTPMLNQGTNHFNSENPKERSKIISNKKSLECDVLSVSDQNNIEIKKESEIYIEEVHVKSEVIDSDDGCVQTNSFVSNADNLDSDVGSVTEAKVDQEIDFNHGFVGYINNKSNANADTRKKKNFTEFEKKLLGTCILKYRDIIENKKTDGSTVKQKNNCWEKIASDFNNSPQINEKATTKQLYRLWNNIKQRQRSEHARKRLHRMDIGAACSAEPVQIDPVASLVGPNLLVEVDNAIKFDSLQSLVDISIVTNDTIASEKIPEICMPTPDILGRNILDVTSAAHSPSTTKRTRYSSSFNNTESFKRILMQAGANDRKRRMAMLMKFDKEIHQERLLLERAKREEAETRATIAQLELKKLQRELGFDN